MKESFIFSTIVLLTMSLNANAQQQEHAPKLFVATRADHQNVAAGCSIG